jgi:hypothetical protein
VGLVKIPDHRPGVNCPSDLLTDVEGAGSPLPGCGSPSPCDRIDRYPCIANYLLFALGGYCVVEKSATGICSVEVSIPKKYFSEIEHGRQDLFNRMSKETYKEQDESILFKK